jgi:hypothetical protein
VSLREEARLAVRIALADVSLRPYGGQILYLYELAFAFFCFAGASPSGTQATCPEGKKQLEAVPTTRPVGET